MASHRSVIGTFCIVFEVAENAENALLCIGLTEGDILHTVTLEEGSFGGTAKLIQAVQVYDSTTVYSLPGDGTTGCEYGFNVSQSQALVQDGQVVPGVQEFECPPPPTPTPAPTPVPAPPPPPIDDQPN